MIVEPQLIQLMRRFAELTGNPPGRVSMWALGSSSVIDRLEGGGKLALQRGASALQWLSDHWPVDKAWPLGIERPPPHPPQNWPPKRGRPRKQPVPVQN